MGDRLDEIRMRWAGLAPGPWAHRVPRGRAASGITMSMDGDDPYGTISVWDEAHHTAVESAPNDVAWLLAEHERLTRELAERTCERDEARAANEVFVLCWQGGPRRAYLNEADAIRGERMSDGGRLVRIPLCKPPAGGG